MTIDLTDNAPRISYSVSQGATTTSFAVPFEFFDTTDLKVVVDGTTKTITSHYTVSGGDGSTGTVTMSVTGATGGSTVIIYREIPLSRTTDFPASGAFPISTLNTELDRTVALFDDRKDRIDRSIRLLDTDDAATMTLPVKASRVGTVLGFNATTGAVEAGPTIANVNSLADITTNINTVAGIASNVTTVAGIQANVTTVAGISSNVSTVAGISSNVTTVAGKASLITSQFATDMSLVTADFVSDVNTVANSDIINDFNTLATSDIVADMNLLATSSNVTAMANLGVSSVITNMANLNASGVITNIGTVAGSISNVNTVAAADSNISALNASGVISNIATVAGATSNISTVATNISGVNSFAERYRIASSAPSSSLDAGDLYFDTNTNKLNVYDGSNWASTAEAAQRTVTTHNVTSAGTQTISVSYTVGLVDVYLNGLKLNISEGDATASNGSSVVVASASVGDIIEVVALSAFNSANYGTAAGKNVGTTNDTVPVFTSNGLDLAARDLITTGKILYANMYSAESDLPSASTYHGMFAHVHGTGKAYYSHGGNWIALANESAIPSSVTYGIANTNAVKIDHASVASTDYAKFTSSGLEGKSFAEVRSDLNVADGANAYVHPNHSGEVTSTADGATEIADNVVDEANLKVSNTPTNGYFLSAQSGNTGGLTWAESSGGGHSVHTDTTFTNQSSVAFTFNSNEFTRNSPHQYLIEVYVWNYSEYNTTGLHVNYKTGSNWSNEAGGSGIHCDVHHVTGNTGTWQLQINSQNGNPVLSHQNFGAPYSSRAGFFGNYRLSQYWTDGNSYSGNTSRYNVARLYGQSMVDDWGGKALVTHFLEPASYTASTGALSGIRFKPSSGTFSGRIRILSTE